MKSNEQTDTVKILRLYLRHRYSLETEEKVQQWLAKNPVTEEIELASKEYWDSIKTGKDETMIKALKRVNKKIAKQTKVKKIYQQKAFFIVAAIFILLIGISGVLLFIQNYRNPAMIEISTAYGETEQVILPDQTKVWLNAGSSLKYPSKFNQKVRLVRLIGEAFFSVTKNKSKPFVVETKQLDVKVLGTKFNLKAYPEEIQTSATLQEGKIEVQTLKHQKKQMLPNDQLVYNSKTSAINVTKIYQEDIPDWRNGNLIFSEATLSEIFKTLERQFNVSLNIDKTIDLLTEHYTIKFIKKETPEQIIQVLSDMAGDFTYSLKGGQIILVKK